MASSPVELSLTYGGVDAHTTPQVQGQDSFQAYRKVVSYLMITAAASTAARDKLKAEWQRGNRSGKARFAE